MKRDSEARDSQRRDFQPRDFQPRDAEATDEDLARAARGGDAHAYDLLVRRHLRPAMALAWQSTRHLHDAEDVVQEAFHRAVRSLDDYDDRRPFAAWFYTIVRNVARNAHGKRRRRDELAPSGEVDVATLHDHRAPPEGGPLRSTDVARAVDALPPMQQACLRLCGIEGFTSAEAGAMLGISEGTVRTHLHRAKRSLRDALETQPLNEPNTRPRALP